ncbi:MAG: efflux RND transporter periplasmic adaptor subunit [Pirellulales bacterium]|nr:efflux RND transporter periplasmic adaptor subunit [Pirellulales bacterium]
MPLALLLLVGCSGPPAAVETAPQNNVNVVAVRADHVTPELMAVGTIMPVERSRVAAAAEGKVIKFPHRVGAFVREGELLAELRTVTLAIELEGARALLRQREQDYQRTKVGFRSEEKSQAEAKKLAAEATMNLNESALRRLQDLRAKSENAVSQQQLEEAQFQLENAKQLFAEAEAAHALTVAGNRTEEIDAARAAADVQQQEVLRLEDEMQKRNVVAPFSGFIVEKNIDLGEWVPLGGPVATIVNLDEVEVQVNVEESYIAEIRLDQEVEARIDALKGEVVRGVVRQVVPRSDWLTGSRSFPVIVRMKNTIENNQPRLREGMVARITFRGEAQSALLAHKDAIVRSLNGTLVYVVGPDNKVRAVAVREGASSGEYIAVEGDLRSGDLLVTEGVERLRPFDEVAILNLDDASRAVATESIPATRTTNVGGE